MFRNFDWVIFICILFIFSLGMTILFSVAPEFVSRQAVYFGLGLVLFFLFANLDYRIFKSLSIPCYLFSIFLLLLTFFLGRITKGALRWIKLGPFVFQPSEFVKPLFILSFASWASESNLKKFKNILALLFLFLPLAFLIFYQPALGSTIVIFIIFLSIVFAGGLKIAYLLGAIFSGSAFLPLIWRFLANYQKERILAFLNPKKDPLGSGYHLIQSKIAVGSGRIFGRGLGQGTQSHLKFLPEFHSDFIFAALAEELGLIGCFILLFCFFILLWRILGIAKKSKEKFGSLIAVGVFSMIFFQLFVNIGMNINLLPITGITLPLTSSGGSSLVATMISLGLIENITKVERKIL